MICRMSKEQREALIELIEAKIIGASDCIDSLRLIEAEDEFNKIFTNECEHEDTHKQDKTSDLYVS